jgi:surface antigen
MTTHYSNRLPRALCAVFIAALMLATTAIDSYAKPPNWAPAHGLRKKQARTYTGYRGHRWPDDYGILRGRCNRSAVGAVVGAGVGGAIGAAVAREDDRLIAVILGSAVGAVVGHEIAGRMDDLDRGCFGHSLELAKAGQTIRWTNSENGVNFAVTPLRDFERDGLKCREFETVTMRGIVQREMRGKACRSGDGNWTKL